MTVRAIRVFADLRTTRVVDDQGSRSTCVPVAVSYAHEHSRADDAQLAAEALWQHALARDTAADGQGTSLVDVAIALDEHGQPTETLWPYDLDASGPQEPPAVAGPPPWQRATLASVPATAADIMDELDNGRVVVAALALTPAFLAPDDGVIPEPTEQDPVIMRHAVVIIAHGLDADGQWLLIRNSWGAVWGDGGYAWISADHLDEALVVAASISAIH